MSTPLTQHQIEIRRNLDSLQSKPLLRRLYAGFYDRIVALLDANVSGRIVEIGSGVGNLKSHLPSAVSTDLFPNPWLDVVCDGYELPFTNGSLSHLILFDVFHHLRAPNAFLRTTRLAVRLVSDSRGGICQFQLFVFRRFQQTDPVPGAMAVPSAAMR